VCILQAHDTGYGIGFESDNFYKHFTMKAKYSLLTKCVL